MFLSVFREKFQAAQAVCGPRMAVGASVSTLFTGRAAWHACSEMMVFPGVSAGRLGQSWVPFLGLLHQSQPGWQQESLAKGQSVCPSVSLSLGDEKENAVLFLDGVQSLPLSGCLWVNRLVQAPLQPSGSCMFLRRSVLRGLFACFVRVYLFLKMFSGFVWIMIYLMILTMGEIPVCRL